MASTSQVLIERLRAGSQPGARDDPHRVALVVEGGGMRGTISAGMLTALDQLGFRSGFDLVVGTSAGAIAGAFFVTGRGTGSVSMYYDELNSEPFLSKRRLMRFGPALDVRYLIYDAAPRRGLDFTEVSEAEIPVYATLTPVDPDNTTTLARLNGGAERVASVLQATASLPVLAGESKEVDGHLYVDGGLVEQIPWRSAIGLGATHLLIAPTRHVSGTDTRSAQNFIERLALPPVIRSMHGAQVAEIVSTLPVRATTESWSLRAVADGAATALTPDGRGWHGELELIEFDPDFPLPDRLESSRALLVDAVLAGARATVAHFGLDEVAVGQQVMLSHPSEPPQSYGDGALAKVAQNSHRRFAAPPAARFRADPETPKTNP